MALCQKAHNSQVLEQATAMRYAMNADEKQFKTFCKAYAPEETEQREIAEGRNKLRRMLGNG